MLLAHISYFKLGVYTDTRGLLDSNRLERKPKNKKQKAKYPRQKESFSYNEWLVDSFLLRWE